MVPDLLDTIAFIRVGFKYILKEVLGIRGKELRKRIVSIKDFLVKIGSFLVLYCNSKTNIDNYLKGKVSTQHCVEDHPATPEVRLQAVVPVPSNHLSFLYFLANLPQGLHSKDSHRLFSRCPPNRTCCLDRSPPFSTIGHSQ